MIKNSMLVDIIVTTYNRSDILPDTLKSIQAQTYSNWRCWIAEDGQSDETRSAISPFLEDERFVYLPGDHAGRPAAPRNRAMRRGQGDLIAFLDDDDLWLPEKLARQVEFMRRHPACALLGCNAFNVEPGRTPEGDKSLYFDKKSFFGRIDYDKFVQRNYIILSSSMIRRHVVSQAGGFNERLSPAEDYEYWLRIGALGEIYNLSEPLVLFRIPASVKHYPTFDRSESYRQRASVLDLALSGDGTLPSPLLLPGKEAFADACRFERDFYLKGPQILGRLRHELAWAFRTCLIRKK